MRRRNMYYATGLPGWMRLGYSPGWVGRSASGLGPCAEYLMTGQWPAQVAAAMGGNMPPQGGMFGQAGPFGQAGQMDRQQRLAFLQAQAEMLEQQLQAIRDELRQMDES